MLYVIDLKTKTTHAVRKYINDTTSGCESVWCDTWYGRHIIGKHCEFINENSICKCGKLKDKTYNQMCNDCFCEARH